MATISEQPAASASVDTRFTPSTVIKPQPICLVTQCLMNIGKSYPLFDNQPTHLDAQDQHAQDQHARDQHAQDQHAQGQHAQQ